MGNSCRPMVNQALTQLHYGGNSLAFCTFGGCDRQYVPPGFGARRSGDEMDIITAPLGGIMNTLLALGAVIVAIVLVLWLLKLLTGATSSVGRGLNRRLTVVDSLALDPKRQL